ncbi:MAG TPA: response regulator [Rhizomicrobium sp.]|nr:response regulator [Rhizomicrobium sp.]
MTPAGYRVLIIDDNAILIDALQDGLRLMGHEVQSSARGTDALRLMHLLDPHVVVADLIMPEFDIFDAFAQMRKIRPSVKIIAISGNQHLLTLASKRGANYVLSKPFDLTRLDMLIKTAMRL